MQAVDSSETSALPTRLKRLSAIRPTISNCNCESPQIRPVGRLTAKYPKAVVIQKGSSSALCTSKARAPPHCIFLIEQYCIVSLRQLLRLTNAKWLLTIIGYNVLVKNSDTSCISAVVCISPSCCLTTP